MSIGNINRVSQERRITFLRQAQPLGHKSAGSTIALFRPLG
jgi:hypothetical protein